MKTTPPLILASGSPRRRSLLAELGFEFEVLVRPVDETVPSGIAAHQAAEYLAAHKAAALSDVAEHHLVLTADTIVAIGDEMLAKPADAEEAATMLRRLSGRTHEVITGVCLRHAAHSNVFHETTEVEFATLSEAEISYYIQTCKPFDKAGAYGIQEWIGMAGIRGIRGDFYNVMGLPMFRLWTELKKWMN